MDFKKNKTTSLSILDIYTKIVSSIENNDIPCGIFLDFAKAFDTVNHTILLQKIVTLWYKGFTILIWSEHIKYTNMKIHKGIGIFYKVRNFVNYQILRSLYYAFFQSHIDYCFNIGHVLLHHYLNQYGKRNTSPSFAIAWKKENYKPITQLYFTLILCQITQDYNLLTLIPYLKAT